MKIQPRIFHKKNVIISRWLGFNDSNLAINIAGHGANVTIIDSLIMNSMQNFFEDLDVNTKLQLSKLEVFRKYDPNIKIIIETTY